MSRLEEIPRERLERMAADPSNAVLAPAILRELARRNAEPVPLPVEAEPAEGGEAKKKKKRARDRRGQPNKTERAYATSRLEPLRMAGEIVRYEFEALTFHQYVTDGEGKTSDIKYTPDYVAYLPDGSLWLHEVKGGVLHEATSVRIKVHAAARPWYRWTLTIRRGTLWKVVHDFAPRREAKAA